MKWLAIRTFYLLMFMTCLVLLVPVTNAFLWQWDLMPDEAPATTSLSDLNESAREFLKQLETGIHDE